MQLWTTIPSYYVLHTWQSRADFFTSRSRTYPGWSCGWKKSLVRNAWWRLVFHSLNGCDRCCTSHFNPGVNCLPIRWCYFRISNKESLVPARNETYWSGGTTNTYNGICRTTCVLSVTAIQVSQARLRALNGLRVERTGAIDILKGRILCSMFYEPSTRTSGSFDVAMKGRRSCPDYCR